MHPGVEASKRLVVLNTVSSVVAFALNVTVLVWLQQYLLRRISPDEYILLPVIGSLIVFAPLLSVVLTSGLTQFVTEAHAQGDDDCVTSLVSTIFPILCATGVLVLVVSALVAWKIDRLLTIGPKHVADARTMLLMLVFVFVIRLVSAPFGTGIFVRQRFMMEEAINIAGQLVRAALLFSLLLWLGPRVLWVAVANSIADLATLAAQRVLSLRLLPAQRFRLSHVRWTLARKLVTFGSWSLVIQLSESVRMAADPLILNKLSTAIDVTCFNLGSLPSYYLRMLQTRALGILQPSVIGMHARSETARLSNTYLRIGRLGLWSVLCFVVPGIVFRREVILLYVGAQYLPAATVMAILLIALPMSYGNALGWLIAAAQGKIRMMGIRTVIAQSGHLLATLVLVGILKLGAVGSAFGALVGGAVLHPIIMWRFSASVASVSLSRWFRETVLRGVTPALMSVPFFLAARYLVNPDSWQRLGLCVLGGELAYVASLVLFSLAEDDRGDLAELLRRVTKFCANWAANLTQFRR